jgi:hypothetical protein
MWHSLLSKATLVQHLKKDIDQSKLSYWFSSETRWEQIKRFLKLSDPSTDKDHSDDRMHRIRELFEFFMTACKACYQPSESIALDEAMKKFKGRCKFKQYIKNKPVRWGLKIYCVACSETAYLCNAEFYLGKNLEEVDQDTSVLQQTCLRLLRPFANHNRIVHIDNYYTSIPLLFALKELKIKINGTVRTNRKCLCKEVIMRKAEETQLKKNPGTYRFASFNDMVFMSWFDKRSVAMLSNAYPAVGDFVVKHWYPAKAGEAGSVNGKIQKEVVIPPPVHFYNKNMGGVDTFDQYRAYIKLELKSNKFWHPMMWFVFESALVNSWVLYKATMQKAERNVEFSHFQFRKQIALALASEWESWGCTPRTAFESPTKHYPTMNPRSVRQRFPVDEMDDRFTCPKKHLLHKEMIPAKEGSNSAVRQLLCRQCNTSRTRFWCRKCHAPLCAIKSDCYVLFHTK